MRRRKEEQDDEVHMMLTIFREPEPPIYYRKNCKMIVQIFLIFQQASAKMNFCHVLILHAPIEFLLPGIQITTK